MTIDSASGEQEHSSEQPPQPTKPVRNDQNAMFLRAARAGNLEHVLDFLRTGVDINTCNSNGLNALHLASKEGHNEVVRELLRRGAIVDASTRKGNTALHIASLAGQDIIVTILVEHGANVNAQSLNGFTPLYMSAQENHEVVVRYLLAHGANQALATEDGFTPLAVALQQGHDRIVALLLENDNTSKVKLPALHIAAKKDDTRAASLLLQNEQNPNVTSKSGFTPLHIAAHYGNADIAQLLIEKGANVNFQARHNISPLHVAAKWGRVKLCELVLDKGAIIDCRTRDLLTPLHCAARSGHDSVVEVLIERGAPIASKTKNGLAPLHMAAQGDHFDCARILLYHKANVDEVTVDYLTPLHVAAHCGHVGVAKLLLDRQADPNARALNGFTPLHIACKKNRIKVVELLLKYHASVGATTESGLSPLHVAAFMGCINIVIFLIQQGANVDCETVRGETPLHLAARANQTDIVRVLVRNKANVDAQARELQTPLHIAARLGNSDIALILLNAHANPNAATRDQYTPLHIAAKEGQEEVVQLLLDKKANKQLLTKKGFSPLHLAAKYGNYGVVKLLIEKGTPIDIEGKNQVTPLHVAAHYNNEKVAQLLLEHGARAQACAKNGYTPLHIAAKKNQMEIAQSLLAYRADPNAESRAGFTPLHLASDEGHIQMVALLVEKGSQVNAKAKNGLTPMHLCAQEDRVDVAEQLFKCGADVNSKTNAGYTPLHVACHFGQLAMVKWLVEHGAVVDAETRANYTALHQAAQQGHNHVVRYLLENGASPNIKTNSGQTPLSIAQRLGYVSVVETLRTVTETTVITETTTITDERYKPQNPEAMNETIFSDSEEEADDHQVAAAEHARDFNESITQGLRDSAVVHLIHTGEQQLSKSTSPFDQTDADLEAIIKRAQNVPISTAFPDPSFLENGHDDNIALNRNELIQPSFLISFMVDARGGAMRGCRHSGVRVIIPPRKAEAPTRITCRYLKKEKLPAPLRLSEGEALASRILEMGPAGAKFLGPVILEVPHFASLRGREREIVILRSDDGKFWKEHQLEATEDAVQEVLNESFDAQELQQLDELHTSRITRILTNDFPMYFAVVTRVRQEVHCVGPEGGVILSSVVPHVQAIFPDGSLTKTIKVSLQAQPVPQELVTKLHGNRVAVSPIVTVEPRRRKFHKPITLCIPLPQSTNKGMLTQYQQQPQEKPGKDQKEQPQHEPPTLRLLCSITGGVMPAQWEDITGTTQLTFAGDEISFTTTVSARFWLMDCQTPRDAAKMAQEIYNEAIAIPFMARFAVFARRSFPTEGQLRMFCMTDDKEEKTLEKQEGFQRIAVSRDVEVLEGKHQWLEFAGNLVPVTKRGDQLAVFFQPFQENRLAFNIKVRQQDDQESASSGKVAVMKEPLNRADTLPPQHPICILSITLPDYTGPLPSLILSEQKGGGGGEDDFFKKQAPLTQRYSDALLTNVAEIYPNIPIEFVSKTIGADWARLGRVLGIHPDDIRQIRREVPSGGGQEALHMLKIWVFLKGTSANESDLRQALRQIGRDDICVRMTDSDNHLMGAADSDINLSSAAIGTPVNLRQDFSSKGSLVTPTQANIIVPQQSPPIEVSAVAAAITPTAEPLFGANKIEPAKDAGATPEGDKKEKDEEWARREHPEVHQFEQVQESFPFDDTTMVTKKRTHIISTSQSRVKGLDEFASAAPSAGAAGYSPQSSPAEQQYPIRDEESPPPPESLSISITSQPDSLMTTSSISVKDKIAQFELLKKVEESEDSIDGAKKRFGWHPQPKKAVDKEKSEERKSPRDEQRQPSPVGSDVPGANKSKIPRITSPTRLTPSPTVSPRKQEEKLQEIENNFLLEKFEEKGEANCLKKEYSKITQYLFFEINEPLIEEEEQHFIQKPQVFHTIVTEEPSHVEAFGEIKRRKRDVVGKSDLESTDSIKDEKVIHFDEHTNIEESYKSETFEQEIPRETEKPINIEEKEEEEEKEEQYLAQDEEKEEEKKLEELKQEKVEEEDDFEFVQIPKEEDKFIKMGSSKEEEKEEEKKMKVEEEEIKEEIIVMSEPLQKSEQIHSTVYLDKVPVESFINEGEVLEERRALLWTEKEEKEKLKEESLIEEKPWWKTTKTEKEFLISEKFEKEKLEENEPEKQQKIFVEDKDEGRKLNEEEERDEETDEQSSTHTVIHRPEVLIEEAVDITPLMDRAYSLQGEEGCQTPTMSAARWKSLDERHSPCSLSSPVHSYPSPSPIIEITPPPIEDEEEWERQQLRDNEEENVIIKKEEERNEFTEGEDNQNKIVKDEEQKKLMEEEHEKKFMEEEDEQKRLMKEQEEELQRLVEEDDEREKFMEGDEQNKLVKEQEDEELQRFEDEKEEERRGTRLEEEREEFDEEKESVEEESKFIEEDIEQKRLMEEQEKQRFVEKYEKESKEEEDEKEQLMEKEKEDKNKELFEEDERKESIQEEKEFIEEDARKEFVEGYDDYKEEEDEKNEFGKEEDKSKKLEDEKEDEQDNLQLAEKDYFKKENIEEDVKEGFTEEEGIAEEKLENEQKRFEEEEEKKEYIQEQEEEKNKFTEEEHEKEYREKQVDEPRKFVEEEEKEYIEEQREERKQFAEEEEKNEYIEQEDEPKSTEEQEREYIQEDKGKKFEEEEERKEYKEEKEDEPRKFIEEEKGYIEEEKREYTEEQKEERKNSVEEENEYIEQEEERKKSTEVEKEYIEEDEGKKFTEEYEEKKEYVEERKEERMKAAEEKEYIGGEEDEKKELMVGEENERNKFMEEGEKEQKKYIEEDEKKELTDEKVDNQREYIEEEKEYNEEEDEQRKVPEDEDKEKLIVEEQEDELQRFEDEKKHIEHDEKRQLLEEEQEDKLEEFDKKEKESVEEESKFIEESEQKRLMEEVEKRLVEEDDERGKFKDEKEQLIKEEKDDNNKEFVEEEKEQEEELQILVAEEINGREINRKLIEEEFEKEEEKEDERKEFMEKEEERESIEDDEDVNKKFMKEGEEEKLIAEEQADLEKFTKEEDVKEELIVKDEEFVEEGGKSRSMGRDEQFIKEYNDQNKIKEKEEKPQILMQDEDERNKFIEEDEQKKIRETDELEKEQLFEIEMVKQAGELVDDAIKRALEDSMILHHEEAENLPEGLIEQEKGAKLAYEELEDKLEKLEEDSLKEDKFEEDKLKEKQIFTGEINISESKKSSESEEEDEEISLLTAEEKEEGEGEANNSPEFEYGDGDEELSGEQSQQSPSELHKTVEGEEGRETHLSSAPSSSLLLPSGIPRRPRSPLPPPIAATPPQTGRVVDKEEEEREEFEEELQLEEIKREEEEEDSMLLSDVKMPVDNLLVFSTHKDGDEDEEHYFGPSVPEERDTLGPDLMIVHSKSLEEVKLHEKEDPWLSSFAKEEKEEDWGHKREVEIEETEEEEPLEEPQRQIGGSLDTSPSEKRRRRSSAASAHGSTNGSLSEFERIEQEIIEGGGGKNLNISPHHSPEAGEGKRRRSAGKQQQSPTREGVSVSAHRGSADSLNEFEQLEREVLHEAVATEDIMMLSDIREDEEGEEVEGYELEPISGEEEEDDERDYLGKELKKENNNNEVMMISSGYDSSGQTQQIELIAQQLSPEFEKIPEIPVEKSQEKIQPQEKLLEISEKLPEKFTKEKEDEKIIISPKPDILFEQKPEFKKEHLFKQQKETKKQQNIPSTSEKKDFVFGGGGGEIASVGGSLDKEDDDDSEKTIFETVSVNSADGSEERIVRTAITRVRDPIYSRVRFAGTEDEQQIKAILESGRTDELELRDTEGNVTRLRTVVERGSSST